MKPFLDWLPPLSDMQCVGKVFKCNLTVVNFSVAVNSG